MTFDAILAQVLELLQREGRVSYRALKVRFQLDDDLLEAVKDELIYAKKLAVDEDTRVLVWAGEQASASAPSPAPGTPALAAVPDTDPEREPLAYTPPHLAEKILTSRSALEGERKQVTVLFADLKGSMELLADRDPEEARQLLDPVLERMIAAVHRYEGTVNQVMGDGIMALFGAPIAHEDHAVRACYAARAMQEAIRAYAGQVRQTHQVEIQIRVGLNSGEVVVRAIGNDLHMDYSAIGETTHLAARMEQLAPPGTIRLTAPTLRLVAGLVQVKLLGPTSVKGLSSAVEVFELAGVGPLRTRLQAFAARELTRFVGRQVELEALSRALEQARAGHGQAVAVIGESGVGKTRLFYEFLRSSHTQDWLLLDSYAVSYGKAVPYLPVRDLLTDYFQLDTRYDGRQRREQVIGKLCALDAGLLPMLPAFFTFVDIPVEDRAWQALDPSHRRQRTVEAFTRLLLRESQVQPLLVVFENLHWIDTETQALLDRLLESLPMARILLLVNYRPEYQHAWGSKTYYTQLRLDPLPPTSAEEFLQALLGDDPSLESLKQLLITRTEGNPFFLEESICILVETGRLVGQPEAYRLAQALPTIQVPATVQAVLAARIDRLPPEEKRLLQTAAVIGTDVPLSLFQAVAEVTENALHRGLTHLQAAEFLYETRLFPEQAYTFKHALTHEVAYGSLLQERRRALHARIVDAMETLYADQVSEQVDRLAHHALRGEVWGKAVTYCQQAGARAHDRAAFREAVASFDQARQALAHLPVDSDTRVRAIELRLALGRPLTALGEHGRHLALLGEAAALARTLDDRAWLGCILVQIAQICRITGDHDGAIAAGQQARELAAELGESALQVDASYCLGLAYLAIGDFGQATELLRWSAEAADRASSTSSTVFRIVSRAWLARTLSALGAFAEGRRHGEEALRLATLEGRGNSPMVLHFNLGLLSLAQGDLEHAIRVFDQGLALCRTSGNVDQGRVIVAGLGYAYALQGRLAEGRALLEEGISESIRTGALLNHSLWVAWLSEVCRLAGHGDEAWQYAHQALNLARQHKERANEALALHQLGVVQTHADPPEAAEAEACYRQALTLADELGMRPLQAHCHRGLGTLYAKIDRREQACTALSTAIEMYKSMDMTFWLPQTEVVLAQAGGR